MPFRTPEQVMQDILSGKSMWMARGRRAFRNLPTDPHCKLCAVPFGGIGGAILGRVGFARFAGNPAICSSCMKGLNRAGVYGAELPVSLLFADIRGSTGIGERMSPAEFRQYLDRFYKIASHAILHNDGLVDKFVGDEAIGLFFQGVSGTEHSRAAVRAARALLEEVAKADATADGPIPVGAAVHTGDAYVGSTGSDGVVNDFTALGDVVNTTARLASMAEAGELLVSAEAAGAAELETERANLRTVEVRGRSEPLAVHSFRSTAPGK